MSNFICWNILFYLIDRYLKFEIHSILIYMYIPIAAFSYKFSNH